MIADLVEALFERCTAADLMVATAESCTGGMIAAAITVLDRDGFRAASVERIAEAAETSKGTLLYHFSSKETLYQAVVEALFTAGAEYMTERIAAAEGCRGKLHAYLDSNLRFIAEHAAHVVAVHRILENAAGRTDQFEDVAPLRRLLAAGLSRRRPCSCCPRSRRRTPAPSCSCRCCCPGW